MDIDIRHLTYQLLPPHKRQPNRTNWLMALLSPLAELWDEFYTWRANKRMMVNVNSQVRILEGYLRKKYKQPFNIYIESYNDGLLWIPLNLEESEEMLPAIGLIAEGVFHKEIPLQDEVRIYFNGVDFKVYIPKGLDRTLIAAEIEKYRQALVKYEIIEK
ncbi:MAG: hypothetical protein J1F29_00765 [Lentimicrobiaceae bacterium]|nr:hypothetical protein [Lentimicrobiaceae bacterium]